MEEAVQMVGSMARAGVEISVELLKILAPALVKGGVKIVGESGKLLGFGIKAASTAISNARAEGTVSRKNLLLESAREKSPVESTGSFPSEVTDRLVAKAKEYKIPISVNGNGSLRSISYLERDKDIFAQVMNEWQAERLAPKGEKQTLKVIPVSEREMDSVKLQLEHNGVECWFTQSQDGKIKCNFKAENAEKVNALMEDYKSNRAEIDRNFNVTANVPENERQLEIKAQIAELENAQDSPEMRNQFYEEFAANTEIEFPAYSEKNMEIVHNAMPEATKVAGKAFWEKQGFAVNEGAKGVEIIAPQMDENGNPALDENGKQIFTTTTVYDISETNAFEKSSAQILNNKIEELRAEYDAEKINAFNSSEDKTVVISDELSGNSIEISADSNLRKADVVAVLEEDFGYTPVQAELAANKLAEDLGLGENYFAAPNQMDNIAKMQVNIRYPSDDIALRDVSFSALKLKDGENVHITVTNGDNSVLVTPAELSDSELKTAFKEQLGMSDFQAEKAVAKARKIDSQIQSKLHETVYTRDEGQRTVGIERTSQNAFIVKSGNVTKSYDFNQINLEEKIAADFGIPSENARRVVQKAGNQSVIQNKIRTNSERKRKNAKTKQDPFQTKGTSSKKVKR